MELLHKVLDRGRTPSQIDQDRFLRGQRLAYQCTVDIGKEIRPGWSEKRTANLMDTYLRDHGVRAFFHRSFAWFGDRTAFRGVNNYLGFLPRKDRILQEDEVVILDTAPILESYVCDVGYTLGMGEESKRKVDEAKVILLEFRDELRNKFESTDSTESIWSSIDMSIRAKGYENCHSRYPFGALGHTVHRVPFSGLPGVTFPFGLQSAWMFLSRGVFGEILGPKHNGSKKGLWALEPHIGRGDFGAKFEEILVVEESGRARWLDSEPPPHLREDL